MKTLWICSICLIQIDYLYTFMILCITHMLTMSWSIVEIQSWLKFPTFRIISRSYVLKGICHAWHLWKIIGLNSNTTESHKIILFVEIISVNTLSTQCTYLYSILHVYCVALFILWLKIDQNFSLFSLFFAWTDILNSFKLYLSVWYVEASRSFYRYSTCIDPVKTKQIGSLWVIMNRVNCATRHHFILWTSESGHLKYNRHTNKICLLST